MVTIQLLDPPDWALELWGDEFGRVFLDCPEDLELSVDSALDKISEFQGVSQDATQGATLPPTSKNESILSGFHLVALDRSVDPLPVQVEQDGFPVPIAELSVLGYSAAPGGGFDIELYAAPWVDLLKRLRLSDVDLGSFEYTLENIRSAWAGARDALAIPIPANYGAFEDPGELGPRDLRFWFNAARVLQACFLAIGWQVESEHLFFGDGRYLFAYLSGQFWHSYTDKKAEQYVALTWPAPQTIPYFDLTLTLTEVFDPLNNYNNISPDEYFYNTLDGEEISMLVQVRNLEVVLPPPPAGSPRPFVFFVVLYRRDTGTLIPLQIETALGDLSQPVTRRIEFDFSEREVLPPRSYGFLWGYNDPETGVRSEFILNSVDVFFRPDPYYYAEGDDIPLADLLDPELTGLDLFEGVAHLFNLKVETDQLSKTVTLRPPYDYTSQGIDVEGFFLDNPPIDLPAEIDSVRWEERKPRLPRSVTLDFKDSSDAYISREGRTFDRTFEIPGGQEREQRRPNPLFEPTADGPISVEQAGGSGPIYLPFLWDNDSGRRSAKLGPRVGIYYGPIDQSETWLFSGDVETLVPYMSQSPIVELPDITPIVPLVFRGYSSDLFNRYYLQELRSLYDSPEVRVSVPDADVFFPLVDFRRPVRIPYRESYILIRAESKQEYLPGKPSGFTVVGSLIE